MNRTFAIIKPDAWAARKVGSILAIAERNGLHPDQLWIGQPSEDEWREFYAEHEGREFYGRLCHFMASGPSVLVVFEAFDPELAADTPDPLLQLYRESLPMDAIKRWRALMGATNPEKAEPGTIRALYGAAGALNAVHGSDSEESYRREVAWAMRVSKGGIHRQGW